jgi:hypothetical protein
MRIKLTHTSARPFAGVFLMGSGRLGSAVRTEQRQVPSERRCVWRPRDRVPPRTAPDVCHILVCPACRQEPIGVDPSPPTVRP